MNITQINRSTHIQLDVHVHVYKWTIKEMELIIYSKLVNICYKIEHYIDWTSYRVNHKLREIFSDIILLRCKLLQRHTSSVCFLFRFTTYGDVSHFVDVSNCSVKYLEHVVAKIGFDCTDWGNIAIYLTSPSGTRSRLMRHRPLCTVSGFFYWNYTSVHFWGEDPMGSWTVSLDDNSRTSKSPCS